MPKLIPKIEDRIIEEAEKLFISDGFDGVSMRRLASKLNIAVGTLYNYFPNKTELFYSIMERSWEKTFNEIEALVSSGEGTDTQRRRRALDIIYNGIRSRGAFANKTFELESSGKHAHKIKAHDPQWQQRLLTKLTAALSPLGKGFAGPESARIVQMLLATTRYFILTSGSEEKKADIDFLLKLIEDK